MRCLCFWRLGTQLILKKKLNILGYIFCFPNRRRGQWGVTKMGDFYKWGGGLGTQLILKTCFEIFWDIYFVFPTDGFGMRRRGRPRDSPLFRVPRGRLRDGPPRACTPLLRQVVVLLNCCCVATRFMYFICVIFFRDFCLHLYIPLFWTILVIILFLIYRCAIMYLNRDHIDGYYSYITWYIVGFNS